MAGIIKFFEIDNTTRMVDLNKEWISTIKEFKKILSRDRGSKGDQDGRRKLQAIKEFTFIYHYCDYASKFGNYAEEDKIKQCIANSELPDNFNYEKDEDLVFAINKYKQLQETPSLKMLNEAKEGLHSAYRLVRKIRLHNENELASLDLSSIVEEEEETDDKSKNKKKKVDPLTQLTNNTKNLMVLVGQLEDSLTTISKLEEKVKKELGDDSGLRGGRVKGEREEVRAKKVEEKEQSIFE